MFGLRIRLGNGAGGVRAAVDLLWSLWHIPLIAIGVYLADFPARMLGIATFIVAVTAFGIVIAWTRLTTGSVWPPIVLHGAWNATIQMGFDPAVSGHNAALWVGENGVLVMALVVVATTVLMRTRWTWRRTPRQPMRTTAYVRQH
jgi:membrane protease YdiL (CAAX protease family)